MYVDGAAPRAVYGCTTEYPFSGKDISVAAPVAKSQVTTADPPGLLGRLKTPKARSSSGITPNMRRPAWTMRLFPGIARCNPSGRARWVADPPGKSTISSP